MDNVDVRDAKCVCTVQCYIWIQPFVCGCDHGLCFGFECWDAAEERAKTHKNAVFILYGMDFKRSCVKITIKSCLWTLMCTAQCYVVSRKLFTQNQTANAYRKDTHIHVYIGKWQWNVRYFAIFFAFKFHSSTSSVAWPLMLLLPMFPLLFKDFHLFFFKEKTENEYEEKKHTISSKGNSNSNSNRSNSANETTGRRFRTA